MSAFSGQTKLREERLVGRELANIIFEYGKRFVKKIGEVQEPTADLIESDSEIWL